MARRIAILAAIIAAAVLAATHTHELVVLWQTIVAGDARWLAAALALQAVYYVCYIATYRGGFLAVGIRRRFSALVAPVFGSIFVNTVAPTGGAAGQALLVDDAVREGHSASGSAAALLVAQAADLSGFAVILLAGMSYLAAAHRLDAAEVVASLLLLLTIGAFAGVLVVGLVRPMLVGALFSRLERVSGWTFRTLGRTAPHPWAEQAAAEFVQASQAIAQRPAGPFIAFAIALLGHAADLASFGCVGLAFGVRTAPALLAGYAVTVLFWVVALVPQGVGVSEGAGALVLGSLGVPTAAAVSVALVFRGISFWLPFVIGLVSIRRAGVGTRGSTRPLSSDSVVVRVAATFAVVVGLINIVSAVTPNLASRAAKLTSALPLMVHYGHLAAALAGIALLYIARGLAERKRTAWWLALGAMVIGAVSHLIKGFDYEEALITAVAVAWLASKRDVFHARSDAPSMRKGVRSLLAAFVFTMAYGAAGFWLLDRHFAVNYGLTAALRQSAAMFLSLRDPGLEPITGFGRWFADSIYVIAAATFGYALLQLMRPVIRRAGSSAGEVRKARAIAEEWGRTSLARVAVLPDKAFHFTPGGSVVCYAVRSGVAIALGDPIGPDEDFSAAIESFAALCEGNGWTPVFYQTTERGLEVYRAHDFREFRIGHEAVVDVRAFSLAGKSFKSLRNRLNVLAEQGYTTSVIEPPIDADTLAALRETSDEWLTAMHGAEMRFSLGWFDDAYIAEGSVFVVEGPDGTIEAFANIVSEYRANEITIDLMRHRESAPSGTMDLMFVRLFEWAAEQGYDTFNLGLAALAGVGEAPEDPLLEKAMRLVYEHANSFYSFKGLRAYKEKFDPEWQPRYLVYRAGANPLAIATALAAINSDANPVVEYAHEAWRRLRRAPA